MCEAACRQKLSVTDVVGRIDGDEFVVLFPGTATADAGVLMNALRESFQAESGLTASIGVAELSADHTNLTSLLASADERLYEAKRGGRNRGVGR